MIKKTIACIAALLLLFVAVPSSAQTANPPAGPVYIVQSGDTLWDISIRFNVTVDEILAANNISNQTIYPGDQLVIPGFNGVSGTLITEPVPLGESLLSLERQYQVDPQLLIKLNHLVSPTQIYAGKDLILLQQDNQAVLTTHATLGDDDTLLELAVRQNSDPWTIAQVNQLSEPAVGLPGDVLFLPGGNASTLSGVFPDPIVSAVADPLPIQQGATAQIKVSLNQAASLSGMLIDHPLHFFPTGDGTYVALQGVYAMTDPGLYPLQLDVTLADGSVHSFEQMVMITSGNFKTEKDLEVDPSTIDPAITGPEDAWLLSLVTPVTPQQYWQGLFQMPVASDHYCEPSVFGSRRSYNNGALHNFHTGIDFGVCSPSDPFDIYAPADGVVVYTGLKTVRGNATIIDHGEGVYSGLYHQAEFYVSVGQHVTKGELIGKIGATGRVTGPHVHWDLWVNGVQVNPQDWLETTYPH
jgi:murein DD-endopeptidase MepM/ murein hydrolase activator NlpD